MGQRKILLLLIHIYKLRTERMFYKTYQVKTGYTCL